MATPRSNLIVRGSRNRSRRVNQDQQNQEEDQYDGIWINAGITVNAPTAEDPDATKFIKLGKGFAVSDLETQKIFARQSAEFQAEILAKNGTIEAIREIGLELDAGEGKPIFLELEIYRRAEDIKPDNVVAIPRATMRSKLLDPNYGGQDDTDAQISDENLDDE